MSGVVLRAVYEEAVPPDSGGGQLTAGGDPAVRPCRPAEPIEKGGCQQSHDSPCSRINQQAGPPGQPGNCIARHCGTQARNHTQNDTCPGHAAPNSSAQHGPNARLLLRPSSGQECYQSVKIPAVLTNQPKYLARRPYFEVSATPSLALGIRPLPCCSTCASSCTSRSGFLASPGFMK